MDGQLVTAAWSLAGVIVLATIGLATLIVTTLRGFESRLDARMERFESAMDVFRSEILRLSDRQSRLEGRIDERRTAAAD